MAGASQTAKKALEFFIKSNMSRFGRVLKQVSVVNGGNGNCTCEMPVEEEHLNRQGHLHGGMTATLVDTVGAASLSSIPKTDHNNWVPGVSLQLSISYLKGVALGDQIVIDAKTVQIKEDVAVISVDIKDKQTGTLVAQANHTRRKGTA